METALAAYKLVGGWKGCLGLVVILTLSVMLAISKGETRHWKKQSGRFEQLYAGEKAAFAGTVANYRLAAAQARASDAANAARVVTQQASINKERTNALTDRLADADARYRKLLVHPQGPAHPGSGGATDLSAAHGAGSAVAAAPGQDRLPDADALIATRQAIQLDELVKWVRQTLGIDRQGLNAPIAAPAAASAAKEPVDRRE